MVNEETSVAHPQRSTTRTGWLCCRWPFAAYRTLRNDCSVPRENWARAGRPVTAEARNSHGMANTRLLTGVAAWDVGFSSGVFTSFVVHFDVSSLSLPLLSHWVNAGEADAPAPMARRLTGASDRFW